MIIIGVACYILIALLIFPPLESSSEVTMQGFVDAGSNQVARVEFHEANGTAYSAMVSPSYPASLHATEYFVTLPNNCTYNVFVTYHPWMVVGCGNMICAVLPARQSYQCYAGTISIPGTRSGTETENLSC